MNLTKLLSTKKEGFSIEEIKDILGQLNNTFRILVENRIIHREIKLENILIKYENKEKTKYILN